MSNNARRVAAALLFLLYAIAASAAGPRFIAGSSYFDPSLVGEPVRWPGGVVSYFVDQGDLSESVSHTAANAAVAAAAAVWNAVPTAAVSITLGGTLAENVSGANVAATATGITIPPDIASTAIATPVAVVYDADGSVIDAFYGLDASDPNDCIDSGVLSMVDNLTSRGNIAHALILINGRCTGTPVQLEQIQFQLTRAFGRVLGLDWSQANDAIITGPGAPSYQQLEGWPLMRPIDLDCNQLSVQCLPNPLALRPDDVASVSRLYPVTTSNLPQFAGKVLTAATTISIHGTVSFRSGQGMQGVNVVARPIVPGVLLPDDRYAASSVSGFAFSGIHGNAITGFSQTSMEFGSDQATVEGFYDITGITLPPGQTQADYQVTLEPINPLYTGNEAVGPYHLGSPTPSGTTPSITVRSLSAGMSIEQDFTVPDSADDLQSGVGGSSSEPAAIPAAGEWQSRVETIGQAAWFSIPAQGGRHFTVEAQALDQQADQHSEQKLRPVLGVWNASDPPGNASPGLLPVNATISPFNGAAPGVSALAVDAIADGELLLGIADQRGDGRPDYAFHGRLLYVSSVSPSWLPLAGGVITIAGSGFHPGMTVALGNAIGASVTEITPTTIVATAPPASQPTGSVDLVVTDPATNGIAAIAAGISYGDATADTLSITTAPPSSQPTGVGTPFTVRVLGADQVTPMGGVPVSFAVLDGSAAFGACSTAVCSITTTGDGYATASVTPLAPGWTKLQATLTNGNAIYTEFTATPTPSLASLTTPLFIAPGAIVPWIAQVEVWSGETPAAGVSIAWSSQGAPVDLPGSTITNSQGMASLPLNLGPWSAGDSFTLSACIVASAACVALPVYTVHPDIEQLAVVSGTAQQLLVGEPLAQVVVRMIAPGGQPIVGGVVTLTGEVTAWTPPCLSGERCSIGRLLGAITQTAISAADGSTSFQLSASADPQRLRGLATVGSSAAIPFDIEIRP